MVVLLTSGGWIVAAALTMLVVTKSNAANAVRNANLWSRRTREARSCCRWVFSKLLRSTIWKWTSTSRSVLVHFHIVESWKVRKRRPCCCNPGTQSSPDLQQRKTRIGQLNLCRMKLPYRQRQQERASRVRRDHKLALRTAFAASLLVTTSVVSAAATIQPPEVRRTAIARERLCWNDHADKSEREGTFQRKYRVKRYTFKKLLIVALLRPALERDYCKK